ncbi:MAG: sugar ABC transporter permease [Chloroflexota bacterium]|nr:sugar ABC transporter permease [Chloroflexota bacterium]
MAIRSASLQTRTGLSRRPWHRLSYTQKRDLWGLAFALPALAFFLVFAIVPIARTFFISFFDYNLLTPATFVGLQNFESLASDARFQMGLGHSFLYVAMTYIPVWIIALALALALNAKIRARTLFRTIYFLPVVMSWAVVSVIWKLIFHRNGLVNSLALAPLGISPQNWLTDQNLAAVAITVMSMWKEVGFFMVVFLAGLQAISPDHVEAARVDGSNQWQVFRFITVPLLQPTILFATVIGLITGLQVFIPQFVMTNGGPVNATLVVTLDIYETAFVFLRMGKAAAMSVVLFVIIAMITLIQFRLYRSRAYDS